MLPFRFHFTPDFFAVSPPITYQSVTPPRRLLPRHDFDEATPAAFRLFDAAASLFTLAVFAAAAIADAIEYISTAEDGATKRAGARARRRE